VTGSAPTISQTPWVCPGCGRAFRRTGQQHSCHTVRLDDHLWPAHPMRPLFDHLLARVRDDVGPCEVVALNCCVHLAGGTADFLAVLPRKRHLEVRFSLGRELQDPRVERTTRTGTHTFKHRVDVTFPGEVDEVLLGWIREAYRDASSPPAPRTRASGPQPVTGRRS
jgi:hypothetical protein